MAKTLSEEFKDQKINDILEDYIALEKEIKEIPEKINDQLADLKKAIRELPNELSIGIKTLADGVEEAENSYHTIAEKHRAILYNQLDETKLELRQAINTVVDKAVSDSLGKAKDKAAELESKVNFFSENIRDSHSTRLNYILSLALLLITIVFGIGLYGIYDVASKNKNEASLWYSKYQEQQKIISTLPVDIQKKLIQ